MKNKEIQSPNSNSTKRNKELKTIAIMSEYRTAKQQKK